MADATPTAPQRRTIDVVTGDAALDAALRAAVASSPNRPAEALVHSREALARAEEAGSAAGRAYAHLCEGNALLFLSDHDAALVALTQALAEMEPLGDLRGRSLVLGSLASLHVSLGNLDEALEAAHDAIQLARALGDTEQEAWMLAGLGNSYVDLGETERAMEAGEMALRLFGELDDPNGQARAHTVLGGALRQLERLEEARVHHKSALRIAEETDFPINIARAVHDLGELEEDAGHFDAALDLHHRALALRREVGNRQAQSSSLLRIGETLSAKGEHEAALQTLHQAREIAMEVGAEPRLTEIERALADAYERDGQRAQALVHIRRFIALRESLLSAQAQSRIQTIEVRAEAERANQEAEIARMRTEELGTINDELSQTLLDLRNAQRELVQAEKLASLGRLSAGLAHEIQNPLNFVANFADLNAELATDLRDAVRSMRAGAKPPDLDDVEADLEAIVDNARRVRDHSRRAELIVEGLMGHVRDVGGERRPADLHELLERAVSTAVPRASPVRIERAYAPDLAPVDLVPGSVQRVFVNLIENACWSLERRALDDEPFAPTLTLATEAYDGGIQIQVADNGLGIPLANCARVFEPFFTTKPAGQGTGLGLSLAYDIVTEGHGGTLAVVSREGEGATFTITLPA